MKAFAFLCGAALFATTAVQAQEPLLLVDRSSSVNAGIDFDIQLAITELGEQFIEVIPWSSHVRNTLWGRAVDLSFLLPPAHGYTNLNYALQSLVDQIECRHVIVIVDGVADEISGVRDPLNSLLSMNQVTVLVITQSHTVLSIYEGLSRNHNYQALLLEPGVLSSVYNSSSGDCVVHLG